MAASNSLSYGTAKKNLATTTT
uniref:Uncharacterized protein n=1 Tax=Arundo donax TaxID=35708 RepID=A0A0A9CBX9_ARUDO